MREPRRTLIWLPAMRVQHPRGQAKWRRGKAEGLERGRAVDRRPGQWNEVRIGCGRGCGMPTWTSSCDPCVMMDVGEHELKVGPRFDSFGCRGLSVTEELGRR